MPRLENWSIGSPLSSVYMAPEARTKVLHGNVYDHDRFSDGDVVTTSGLVSLDIPARVATTRNTAYVLGDPDPEYVKYCESIGQPIMAAA